MQAFPEARHYGCRVSVILHFRTTRRRQKRLAGQSHDPPDEPVYPACVQLVDEQDQEPVVAGRNVARPGTPRPDDPGHGLGDAGRSRKG